jgi:uncharacterized membrane protein YdbT with pleckstrin-like domain
MNPSPSSPSAPAPAPAAASETVLWEGTPSSWQNFWWWLSIIGIPVAIAKHIGLKSTRITLTNQRLRIRSGIFNKTMEEIELYRVKDWTFTEPFLMRMMGYGSVQILSSDRSAPEVNLTWLKGAPALAESLRAAVESVRDRKRVREVDSDQTDASAGHGQH